MSDIERPELVAAGLREAAQQYESWTGDDDVDVTQDDVRYLHDLADDLEALDVCNKCGETYRAHPRDPPVCERCFREAMADRGGEGE